MATGIIGALGNLQSGLSATGALPMFGIDNPFQKELDLNNQLDSIFKSSMGVDFSRGFSDLSKGNIGDALLHTTPIGATIDSIKNLDKLFTNPEQWFQTTPLAQAGNAIGKFFGLGKKGRRPRGGANYGNSPLSSSPDSSQNLGMKNILRTIEQADQLAKQAQQIQQSMAPLLDRFGISRSWIGLGHPQRRALYSKMKKVRGGANYGFSPLSSSASGASASLGLKNVLRALESADELAKEAQQMFTAASPYIAALGAFGAATGADKYFDINKLMGKGKKPRHRGGAQYGKVQQQMMCINEDTGNHIQCLEKYQGMAPNWNVSFVEPARGLGRTPRGGAMGGVCGGKVIRDSGMRLKNRKPVPSNDEFLGSLMNRDPMAAENRMYGGKKPDGRQARAQIVRQVMQQRGVSLPQASRIVKSEGLY